MQWWLILGLSALALGACGSDDGGNQAKPGEDGGANNDGSGDNNNGGSDNSRSNASGDNNSNRGPCGKGTFKSDEYLDVVSGKATNDQEISIDDLKDYTVIEAELSISDSVSDLSALNCAEYIFELNILGDNVTSLSPLANLREATGLNITGANALPSLAGLENLQIVEDLVINSNDLLPSLEGLGALEELNSLEIEENPILSDIDALAGVTYVDGYLGIADNPMLPGCAIKKFVDGVEVNEEPFIERNLVDSCTP